MMGEHIIDGYEKLKKSVRAGTYSSDNWLIIKDVYVQCLDFLDHSNRVDLISLVSGKSYFCFERNNKTSRAINAALFHPSIETWDEIGDKLTQGTFEDLVRDEINIALYSCAISFCAAIDLIKIGDQKTPGTFFEIFIAFFFTWRTGVEPQHSIQVLNIDDINTSLPTDYVYNLGSGKVKFHMPVKTSTRERAIMLWAHQRVLDGIYGTNRFYGTPVLLAETKTDKRKGEVVEICTPDQWRIYQSYIARLHRIYYLDPPSLYNSLVRSTPPIFVKYFSEFFFEWNTL